MTQSKKNKMTKVAAGALALCLVAACVLSGSLAKYITGSNTSDSARVAKWGVTVMANGDLFGGDYNDSDNGNAISATYTGSVDTSDGSDIVAPGTKSDAGMVFSVKGTPEVKSKVTFSNTAANNSDIFLKSGTYAVMVDATSVATADNYTNYYVKDGNDYRLATADDEFTDFSTYYTKRDDCTISDDYYPIDYKVTVVDEIEEKGSDGQAAEHTSTSTDVVYNGENALTNVATLLNSETTYNANSKLDKSIKIEWAWGFSSESDTPKFTVTNQTNDHSGTQSNTADTILGCLQTNANSASYVVVKAGDTAGQFVDIESSDYCLTVAFNGSVSVVQID